MWQFENLHILTEVTVEIIYDITFAEHKGNRNAHVLLELDMAHIKYGEGTDTPLQYSCLENPMDGGIW